MPPSIRYFELLMFIGIALGYVTLLAKGTLLSALASPYGAFIFLIALALYVLNVLLISRLRLNWAKWLLIIIFVIASISVFYSIQQTFTESILAGCIYILQIAFQVTGIIMLFRPDAVSYLQRK